MAAFAELGLCPEIIRAVEELGWLLPTPVQQEAVPLILGGGDVMAAAETGSGKTGAFALPVLQICHEALREQQMEKSASKMAAVAAAQAAAASAASVGLGADRDLLLSVEEGVRASAAGSWAGARCGLGVRGGVHYFEVVQESEGGICRVGWAALNAKRELGKDAHGFGFGGTGKKSHGGRFLDYGEPYGCGDVIGCLLDQVRGVISFSKNGRPLGEAFEVGPSLARQPLFPAVCLKGCAVKLSLGEAPLAALPSGATPIARAAAEHAASNAASAPADPREAAVRGGDGCPTALILEPARELCEQVHRCVGDFSRFFTQPSLGAALLVGGVDGGRQLQQLKGGVDVVCGTPGRVADLVKQGKLRLSAVQFFVLDEADRLLDTGNLDTILQLHAKLPRTGRTGGRLQTLLFSATLHTAEVRSLAQRITCSPTLVDLKGAEHVPEAVHHVYVPVDPADATDGGAWADAARRVPTDGVHAQDVVGEGAAAAAESGSEAVKRLKPLTLLRVVERLQLAQCLVFCRTNLDCDNLERFLHAAGGGKAYRGKAEKGVESPYSCVVLAGQRPMEERRRNLAAFKEGDVRFLICTDVAARGLDIKELPCVINMTLPDKEEDYIHRVGRVGRAEVVGLAVSLVASGHREKVWYYDRRKWEGRPLSTKLAELGGCCIWYDEPALLRGVQKRLGGGEVETLDAFLARLPGGVRSLNASLGQAKENGLDAASAERLLALAPTVATLEALETRAQLSFLLGPTALSQRAAAGDDVALRGGAASLGSQPPSPAIAGPDSVASKGAKGRHTHRARQRGGRGRTK